MLYINLLIITFIVVNLIDLSGFIGHVKRWIWRWVWGKKQPYNEFSLKPIDCSYCMSHHIGLLYLLISGKWTLLAYAYLCLLSFLTPIIKDALILIKDILIKGIDIIYKTLHLQ